MSGVQAYPLAWPPDWPRSAVAVASRFKTTFAKSRDELLAELGRLGAVAVTLSMNVPLRDDGLPYARNATPKDPGVAVYFTWKGRQYALACDQWERVGDNLRSVFLTVQAIRGIERWGASSMLERAFTGFAALPPAAPPRTPWHKVLGVPETATKDEARRARRTLATVYHPDSGSHPDPARMAEINAAVDEREAL